MGGDEIIVKTLEELLLQLTPEERAKALPELRKLVDRSIAKGETVVLKGIRTVDVNSEKENPAATNYYVIKREIGRGGMGIVYKAYDAELEREVALKILRGKDEESIKRFEKERKITAQLDHPNFARVLTIGEMDTPDGKMPFYTMPYIVGDNLADFIKWRGAPGDKGQKLRSEFTLVRLLGMQQLICQAIQSAHGKGIMHRDLKPANILVGPYGEVYVVDFGLTKRIKEVENDSRSLEAKVGRELKDEQDLTGDAGMGTQNYMSPEQILEPRKVDHRADIFGLGGILYYILAGEIPKYIEPSKKEVEESGATGGFLLALSSYRIRFTLDKCKIIPPSQVVAERREKLKVIQESGIGVIMPEPVDPALEAICMKALRKNPEERYQSCREMWEALQQFIEGKPEMILENEAKELTKVMSKQNLDKTLENLEMAEVKVQEAINKLERIKRMALEEKLKMIDLQILKARVYDQRGLSGLIVETIEKAKTLIEAPLNITQRQYIRLLIMEGLAKFNQKTYDEAKEIQLKAIELCKSHPEKKLLVSAYHNYAMACLYDFSRRQDMADFNNAKHAFGECYKLADQLTDVFNAVHARTMLANLLLEKNEYREEVKSTLETALKIAAGDNSLTAEVHTLLSWYYFKQNSYHETITHGELAVSLADKTDNQINLNESRLALGQAYHHLGNAEKRIQNLKPVLSFKYAREPLSYEDAIKEFYAKNNLDITELD